MRSLGFWVAAMLVSLAAHANGPVSGPATSAGPGLIAIGEQSVRLWGILMPGRDTAEGAIAYLQFERLIEGRRLSCVPTDTLGGPVVDAICRTVEGTDIAALLVSEGWALDDGQRSRGYYLSEMEEASGRRRGVWGLENADQALVEAQAEAPPAPESVPEPDPQPLSEPVETAVTEPEPQSVPAPEVAAAQPQAELQGQPEARPEAAPLPDIMLQVGSGLSAAQRSVELARLRGTYGWLFEDRNIVLVDPLGSQPAYRALIKLERSEVESICNRLAVNREACLLVTMPSGS